MAALGLEAGKEHWRDDNPTTFTGDAARAHDAADLGPDDGARPVLAGRAARHRLQGAGDRRARTTSRCSFGKEFGNRGQCNPTYFTVGNLVKYLTWLRDEQKIPVQEIVANYVFVTAGACGPCRFGTYVTEYRKALRDSGFEGFRVLLFQQQGGLKQATGEEQGLEMNPEVLHRAAEGDPDRRRAERARLSHPPVRGRARARPTRRSRRRSSSSTTRSPTRRRSRCCWALVQTRRNLMNVQGRSHDRQAQGVDHRRVLGDDDRGRRQLRPAEVPRGRKAPSATSSSVTAWILFMIWEQTLGHAAAHGPARRGRQARKGLAGVNVREEAGDAVAGRARGARHLPGVAPHHGPARLPPADMDSVAEAAAPFYNNHLRGGEGHMEVGKLILNVAKQEGDDDAVGEAVRLHAVVGRLRRRAVDHHREVPARRSSARSRPTATARSTSTRACR